MTDFLSADDIVAGAAYVVASSYKPMTDDVGRVLQNGIDRDAGTTCVYNARGASWTVTVAEGDERAVASIRRAMTRWSAQAWADGHRRPAGAGIPAAPKAPAKDEVADENKYAAPTDRQLSYAASLARQAGYRDVTDARKALRGKSPVGAMKRQECSELIDFLRERISA